MDYLIEGLKEEDLKDLVLPIISVDEYESKIDDDSIVVGFYVLYREPAKDLNRFIQKSATYLLDTDTSPAPTEEGYYMVFLELARNNVFPKALIEILDTLKGLTDIESWSFKAVDTEEDYEVTEENLKDKVRLTSEKEEPKKEKKKKSKKESLELVNFFKSSIADSILFEDDIFILQKYNNEIPLQVVDFNTFDILKTQYPTLQEASRLDESAQQINTRLQSMLGSHWLIEVLDSCVLLSRHDSNKIALVQILEGDDEERLRAALANRTYNIRNDSNKGRPYHSTNIVKTSVGHQLLWAKPSESSAKIQLRNTTNNLIKLDCLRLSNLDSNVFSRLYNKSEVIAIPSNDDRIIIGVINANTPEELSKKLNIPLSRVTAIEQAIRQKKPLRMPIVVSHLGEWCAVDGNIEIAMARYFGAGFKVFLLKS